jgi:AraC-like DNA-binding protein
MQRGFDGLASGVRFLEKGRLTLHYDNGTEHYSAPCWIFSRHHPGRQVHSPDSRILSIRFTLQWPDEKPLLMIERTVSFRPGRFPAFERAARRLMRYVQTHLPGPEFLVQERLGGLPQTIELLALFLGWLAQYVIVLEQLRTPFRSRSALDPRVQVALDYLQSLAMTEPLREKKLAAVSGLSIAQINRLFIRQIGLSPAKIRDRQRLAAATQALLYSKETIKAIAYKLGFHSPQHFAFWFHRRTGESPRSYRSKSENPRPPKAA